MTKTKLSGFAAAFAGIVAAIITARGGAPKPAVHVPPAPQVYALGVHLFDGDPAQDEKIPGAVLTLQERTERTDGAGNAAFVNLTAGTYEVCATAEGFVRGCATAPVPGPDVDLVLARDVPPTVPLTTDGRIFLQGGQPWRWKGVSAFQLLDRWAHGEDIEPFLRAYKGFNVLRVWLYTPRKEWGDSAWDAPGAPTVRAFLDRVALDGWYVELTLLTDDDPVRLPSARALVADLAQAPRPSNLLLEIGNEPRTHKAIDTRAMKGALDASGFLYASGDYEESARAFGSYLVTHTGRDSEWPRRAHDLLEFYTGGGPNDPGDPAHRVPIVADEPAKLQDVGGDRVNDWRAYFGTVALLGAGGTFHAETGKFARLPTPDESALAAAALDGLNAFPADAPRGGYARLVESSLRTYVVGPFMVRVRPQTATAPEAGWNPIGDGGVLWRR
jgi:hypothetical protein